MSNRRLSDIPDSIRPHLDEIAKRLWSGRAAVMIGAGFSKNADDRFPDWNQLGALFYEKIHGVKPDGTELKNLNVPRIAEEVKTTIGRHFLEDLVKSNIPGGDIEPSVFHVKLLELPWVDVFTTNYDTLLESASAKVVTRQYESVIKKEDLPNAIKPRIVKLHGSSPYGETFIITEEDYQSYPRDNALFVNTIQQALLENIFCLIGFSGNDQNFFKWRSWIHDNLGRDKMQKIYLIGLFDLSSDYLQLLAEQGIIVVDFSCCKGLEKCEYKKALNYFFDYMSLKKPDSLDWPFNSNFLYPMGKKDRIQKFLEITEEWRRKRQDYPGWLILPHDNREDLWLSTEGWIDYLPDMEVIPSGLDIQYVFELIWRVERCLIPISDNIAACCEKLLEKYWPFHIKTISENYQLSFEKDELQYFSWNYLQQSWLAISLSMLRYYREKNFLKKWEETEKLLKILIEHLSEEQKEFLNYEGVLFSLFVLDISKAKERLDNWHPNESQPYWLAKRAGILAELGFYKEAEDQIQLSLVKARKNIKKGNSIPDYSSISSEAYGMVLLSYVQQYSRQFEKRETTPEEDEQVRDIFIKERKEKNNQHRTYSSCNINSGSQALYLEQDWEDLYSKRFDSRSTEWDRLVEKIYSIERKIEREQQKERWDELKKFRCDPWDELRLFELNLKKPLIQIKPIEQRREFDIDYFTNILHFSTVDKKEYFRPYAFLRFCEEVGLPYHIGNFFIANEPIEICLERVAPQSYFLAVATFFRLGKRDAVDRVFNRNLLSKVSTTDLDHFILDSLDLLDKCQKKIQEGTAVLNDNYGVCLASLLPEVISRLCCKCSIEIKCRILDFIRELYSSPDKVKYTGVGNLTQRLIESLSKKEQYNWVPDLLRISYPQNLDIRVANDFFNPFHFLTIDKRPDGVSSLEIEPEMVEHLLHQVRFHVPQSEWAMTSLIKLHELELLDSIQYEEFSGILWDGVDDRVALPRDRGFYKFIFLLLPHPEKVDPFVPFKKYIRKLAEEFSIRNLAYEMIGTKKRVGNIWTDESIIFIFNQLVRFWDGNKSYILKQKSLFKQKKLEPFYIVSLLSEIVLPMLKPSLSEPVKKKIQYLFDELEKAEIPFLEAEAASIHIFPKEKLSIHKKVENALISKQSNFEEDGLKAIEYLIIHTTGTDSAKSELLSMLSQYLTWAPIRSVEFALDVIIRILTQGICISSDLEIAIQGRLEKLLVETSYENTTSDLNVDEKLQLRRTSSLLAKTLFDYYSLKLHIPEIIMEWKKKSLSPDEFAEVTNIWKDF